MTYQVTIDMTLVLQKIKHLKIDLGIFSNDSLMLTLEADNPDDACYLAFKMFSDHVLSKAPGFEIKNLLKDLKYDFIVMELIPL